VNGPGIGQADGMHGSIKQPGGGVTPPGNADQRPAAGSSVQRGTSL
jgi:hypothetical protein